MAYGVSTTLFLLTLCYGVYAQIISLPPVNVDLCNTTYVSFSSLKATKLNYQVSYRFSTKKCQRPILIYPFFTKAHSKYFTLEIFEFYGKPLNMTLWNLNNTLPYVPTINSTEALVVMTRVALPPTNKNNQETEEIAAIFDIFGIARSDDGSCVSIQATAQPTKFLPSPSTASYLCTNLYYFYFSSYTKYGGVSIKLDNNPKGLKMFKGISVDETHSVTGPHGELPSFVYDPFFTIQATRNASYTITIGGGYQQDSSVSSPGVIMSQDYANDFTVNDNQRVNQKITINKFGNYSIRLQVIRLLVQTEVAKIQVLQNGTITKTKTITATDGKLAVMDEQADQIVILYSANDTYAYGGLLATVTQGDNYTRSSGSMEYSVILMIVLFLFI